MVHPNQHTEIPAKTPEAGSAELELASTLYGALACGHERLGFHVAGTFPLWRRGQGGRGWEPVPGCDVVPAGEWRPCVEVLPDGTTRPRRFNPWVLRSHVEGRYHVAPHAPSWAAWIRFDLDAHVADAIRADASDEVIPLGAVRRAHAERDEVLAELWRALALGPGREPVVSLSPGHGYHVDLPLTRGAAAAGGEHTWPAAEIVERVTGVLHRRGVQLRDGRLELYPAARPLRAPCGRGSVLLRATRPECAAALELEPVAGTVAERRWTRYGESGVELVRKRWAQVAAYLAQIEAARRPLDEWLREPAAAWSGRWGPFAHPEAAVAPGEIHEKNGAVGSGALNRSQHKDEVTGAAGCGTPARVNLGSRSARASVGQGGIRSAPLDSTSPISPPSTASPTSAGAPTGKLRRGREFWAYLGQLVRQGVVTPSTRHDAILSLVFGLHVTGKNEGEVRAALETWCGAHAHVSKLKGARFVRQTMREGMHYYHRIKKLPQRARAFLAAVGRTRPLGPADLLVVARVRAEVREEAWAILEYLHGHADRDGHVYEPVTLGRAQLAALLGGERRVDVDGRGRRCRAEVIAVRELERLGVLALWCDYSTGHHGRIFSCWYAFGSGMLAMPREPGGRAAPHQSRGAAQGGAGDEVLVLAERHVREGLLRVVSDGTRRRPWVELEPAPWVNLETGGGAAWWRGMYERRQFTVRDLRAADEAVVIAGPWAAPPRGDVPTARYGVPVEELPAVWRRSGRPSPPTPAPVAPVVAAVTPAAPVVAAVPPAADARAALAAELGADVAQLADYPADLAAIAARTWRAFEPRR
jgi:hypothetical protein